MNNQLTTTTTTMLRDAHTHNPEAGDAIISVGPDATLHPGRLYSVGIHPWAVDDKTSITAIESLAEDPRVVAIGETGIDRLRGASLSEQERLLLDHVALSERLGKPLIVHCVRAYDALIALHRRLRPSQPWIIHGFRGKPAPAQQLLDEGLYLSLGSRFNAETAAVIPPDRLLNETDDDRTATINAVAAAVAAARSTTAEHLLTLTSGNLEKLIPTAGGNHFFDYLCNRNKLKTSTK